MQSALNAIKTATPVHKTDPYDTARFSGWSTAGLFHTHPPLDARIAALDALVETPERPEQLPEVTPTDTAIPPLAPAPNAPEGDQSALKSSSGQQSAVPHNAITGVMSFGA
jgi:hypothetical protein